jgi:very-short-patch-repair endonuclease
MTTDPTGAPGAAATEADPAVVLLRRAPELGLARHNLLSLRWERLSRGLYGARAGERTPTELARALGEVLPRDSGFGHLFSARVRDWWMPNRLGPHVALATTTSAVHVQRQGLYVRRSRYGEFEEVDGVRLSTAAQTLVELARDLVVADLVPMVDCALRDGAVADEILAAARPRVPGARRLRQAVALADPRSESWWESVLRLLHVLPGLGPVECQAPLEQDGTSFGRADLHLVGTRRFAECDGGRHREKERHDHDLRREKLISRGRYERYGYTTSEITHRPGMIIRDAEDARGWPHDPTRLRTWWAWAGTSTLTPYGRTLLAARLERYRLAARR